MKLKIVVFLSALFLSLNIYSQKLETFFSSGYSFCYIPYESGELFFKVRPLLFFSPRLNLPLKKEMSVSLDTQPSVIISSLDWFDDNVVSFYIPTNVNFNFGYASTKDSQKDIGFFAGFGPAFTPHFYIFDDIDYNHDFKGFNIRFGVRYKGRKNVHRELYFYYSSDYTLKNSETNYINYNIPIYGIGVSKIVDYFHGN